MDVDDGVELVVDSGHAALVVAELRAALAELGVTLPEPALDAEPALRLSRVAGLGDLEPARAAILGAADAARRSAIEGAKVPYTDLDVVLEFLRARFAGRFHGWTPTMGKNRTVATVVPFPPGGGSVRSFFAFDPADPRGVVTEPIGDAGDGVLVGMVDAAVYPDARVTAVLTPDSHLVDVAAHAPRWRSWEGHGLFVADTIRRRAPRATIRARAVIGAGSFDGAELGRALSWDVAREIARIGDVDVLNLSLGCLTADGRPPLVLSRAIDRLTPRVLVVAAAGNHGATENAKRPMWPAALPDVVAVRAAFVRGLGDDDFNPDVPWLRCAAPGVHVTAAFLDEDEVELPQGGTAAFTGDATWSGTSFAAAATSGAVAARMTTGPERLSAHEAFARLLTESGDVVQPYEWHGASERPTP